MALVLSSTASDSWQLTTSSSSNTSLVQQRVSHLASPTMLLTGHQGEIYSVKFNPQGTILASSSADKTIQLWSVFAPDCSNFLQIKGHKGQILEIQWTKDGSNIVSCSVDKTLHMYDCNGGERVKQMKGHSSYVNSCDTSRKNINLIVSGSDDCTTKIWDTRVRGAVSTFRHQYSITSTAFSDDGNCVFTGGIENVISMWDLRRCGGDGEVVMRLAGHQDTITGLALSKDGSFLLSNAMDSTLRIWDVRPYAPANRCVKLFQGHQHNFEKHLLRCAWSPDGQRVTCGSSDRLVNVWDTTSRRLLYQVCHFNHRNWSCLLFHQFEFLFFCSSLATLAL
eukprot:TRINITY_DN2111_c0_g1_i2.p1 TRINITY_DN2111_c0_g1~~TRINITY_DN2111_c0_g1_i2.p1  ORF type:complete len:337 (-),score=67.36 TRINITY_DN2111_c0_g1_i2:93-1103(-)